MLKSRPLIRYENEKRRFSRKSSTFTCFQSSVGGKRTRSPVSRIAVYPEFFTFVRSTTFPAPWVPKKMETTWNIVPMNVTAANTSNAICQGSQREIHLAGRASGGRAWGFELGWRVLGILSSTDRHQRCPVFRSKAYAERGGLLCPRSLPRCAPPRRGDTCRSSALQARPGPGRGFSEC